VQQIGDLAIFFCKTILLERWSDCVAFKQSKNWRSCHHFSVKPFLKSDEDIVLFLTVNKIGDLVIFFL